MQLAPYFTVREAYAEVRRKMAQGKMEKTAYCALLYRTGKVDTDVRHYVEPLAHYFFNGDQMLTFGLP